MLSLLYCPLQHTHNTIPARPEVASKSVVLCCCTVRNAVKLIVLSPASCERVTCIATSPPPALNAYAVHSALDMFNTFVCAGSGAALRLTVNRATMFWIALATKLNYNGFELNKKESTTISDAQLQ